MHYLSPIAGRRRPIRSIMLHQQTFEAMGANDSARRADWRLSVSDRRAAPANQTRAVVAPLVASAPRLPAVPRLLNAVAS